MNTQKPHFKLTCSIEVLPKHLIQFKQAHSSIQNQLNEADFQIFIPHLNRFEYTEVLHASEELISHGFRVVPHLAVRNLRAQENIPSILHGLAKLKITQVLLLGGDSPEPKKFSSVLDFLQQFNLNDYGVQHVFLPSFPDLHPHKPRESLEILRQKISHLKNQSIQITTVSQLGFDAQSTQSHFKELSQDKSVAHSILGFAAPCQLTKLAKIALTVGINNSLSFLKKGNFFKLLQEYDSDELVEQMICSGLISGIHCYPFANYQGALTKLVQYTRFAQNSD